MTGHRAAAAPLPTAHFARAAKLPAGHDQQGKGQAQQGRPIYMDGNICRCGTYHRIIAAIVCWTISARGWVSDCWPTMRPPA